MPLFRTRHDEGYMLITAQNAAAAATRGRQAGGQGMKLSRSRNSRPPRKRW
jgi:hypothetical protein